MAAAAAGAIAGCESKRAPVPAGPMPPPEAFPRRKLGRNGPLVPILQQGGDYYCPPRLVKRCMDLGVRSFDTADNYANSRAEQSLGDSLSRLKIKRGDVFVATKGRPKRPEDILGKCLPASLRRLRTDYVDAWYVHDLEDPDVLSNRAWREAAAAAKQAGKIKLFGLSCHNDKLIEVMNAASRCGWVDVVMLRYNFRSHGDRALNEAISACHKAGVGLIAMKTQASAVSFVDRVDPFRQQGYNRHQAVLKAVWQDERIAAAVSAMPTLRWLEENAAAAFDRLSVAEAELLREYDAATRSAYCPGGCGGCRRECEAALETDLAVADILRYLTYHDSYGRRRHARRLFQSLPPERRRLDNVDLASAQRACPNGLDLTTLLPAAFHKMS